MLKEAPVLANTRLEACRMALVGLPMRLLRNNRGEFYTLDGVQTIVKALRAKNLSAAIAAIKNLRRVAAGFEAHHSADLLGITTIRITQEMVGMEIGVATVAEVKEPEWTKPVGEHENGQANFLGQVNKRGGLGFFITDHQALEMIVKNMLKKRLDDHLKSV